MLCGLNWLMKKVIYFCRCIQLISPGINHCEQNPKYCKTVFMAIPSCCWIIHLKMSYYSIVKGLLFSVQYILNATCIHSQLYGMVGHMVQQRILAALHEMLLYSAVSSQHIVFDWICLYQHILLYCHGTFIFSATIY